MNTVPPVFYSTEIHSIKTSDESQILFIGSLVHYTFVFISDKGYNASSKDT